MSRTAVLFAPLLLMTPFSFGRLSFTQHSQRASGTRLLSTDFNHDGKPDVLVYGGNEPQVLLNKGGGTFRAPISVAMTGATPYGVAVDYNKDGNSDVVACSADGNTGAMNLALLLGDGRGHLRQSDSMPTPCDGLAVVDFGNDGKPDIAVSWSTLDSAGVHNTVVIHYGTGSTYFGDQVAFTDIPADDGNNNGDPPCRFMNGLAAADFNGDGDADIAVPAVCDNGASSQSVIVLGHGDDFGTNFVWAVAANAGGEWNNFRTADVNRDSKPDLSMAATYFGQHGSGAMGFVLMLNEGFNNGSFSFGQKQAELLDNEDAQYPNVVWSGTVADVNGDGINDAIVAEDYTPDTHTTPTKPYLTFLLGNSDGSYGTAQRWSVSASPRDVISGDFNRDGREDVAAILDNQRLVVFLNRGPHRAHSR